MKMAEVHGDILKKGISPPASLEAQRSQRIFVFDLQGDDCKSKESRLRQVGCARPEMPAWSRIVIPADAGIQVFSGSLDAGSEPAPDSDPGSGMTELLHFRTGTR